jgi:hypothetical protein
VILLLLLGWGARQTSDFISFPVPDLTGLLPIFGTIGLILIVLEGALELELNRSKFKLIRKSFFGSFVSMFVLSFIVAYAFYYFGNISMKQSLVNAIPICIISSSVAISSARNLSPSDKEFVIYESSLSDILGVLFFNFMVLNATVNIHSFYHFGIQVLIICLVSFVATIALSFLLSKIDHPIKHAPIIILLILIYAVSEIFHLPALIFILFFGLFLGNIDEMKNFEWIKKLNPEEFNKVVSKFREIVIEAAFLIRAFFFTLFGYSFETKEIINLQTLGNAILILAAIIIIRAVILKISKLSIFPLLFVAPRGLITILLFFAIPASESIPLVNKSLIIQIIVLSVLFMMIGIIVTGRSKKEMAESKINGKEKENVLTASSDKNEDNISDTSFEVGK